ncbi:MAG: hypothetical protein GX491_13000 [Chloroflexi bacterium]|nr:hypothetical protein [Chloroflexota bacterium]
MTLDFNTALGIAGLLLTLIIFLYLLIGDNVLFRLVTYSFIGVASGYIVVLVLFQVLLPRLALVLNGASAMASGGRQVQPVSPLLGLVPFALGLFLFLKFSRRLSFVGSWVMAVLVGVGAAVVVGGAIFGTLFGQIEGTIGLFNLRQPGDPFGRLLEGLFMLFGTVCTLAYFQFGVGKRRAVDQAEGAAARRAAPVELLAKFGQIFIGLTLGALFAGVYSAAIAALVDRVGFIVDWVNIIF